MAARKHDRANSVWPRFCAKRWEVRHDRLSNLLPDPAALQREKALPSTDCPRAESQFEDDPQVGQTGEFSKGPGAKAGKQTRSVQGRDHPPFGTSRLFCAADRPTNHRARLWLSAAE